jgi:hypothetical protein
MIVTYNYLGIGVKMVTNDENCVTKPIRGPEDINRASPSRAFVCSDDRENWMLHDNISIEGVPDGSIYLLKIDQSDDT